jgi:hypothetical protein
MSEKVRPIQFSFSYYEMYQSKGHIVKLIYRIAINLLVLGTPFGLCTKDFSVLSQILTY